MTTRILATDQITSRKRPDAVSRLQARLFRRLDSLIEAARARAADSIGLPRVVPGRWVL